jgi:hypothetical protein
MEDPNAKIAIEQVLTYSRSMGIPIAAISNGRQLAIFLGSRTDGRRAEEGEAIVFLSLEDMIDRFRLLWDMLSRDALGKRSLAQVLMMGSTGTAPPQKLSQSIAVYPGYRVRSAKETDLKILSTVFIQDIEGSPDVSDDFLRECYYGSGTLSQYAFVSKEILRNRYSAVPVILGVETQPVRTSHGVNESLGRDLVAAAVSSRPLVLLGDVGVGKTMFIRHLLRIEAVEELKTSLVFYVDFGVEPALQADLQRHVVDRVFDELLDDYGIDAFENAFVRAVYNGDLNRFARGINAPLRDSDRAEFDRLEIAELRGWTADRANHLERALKHLAGSAGRRSVVVLDNVDQRPLPFQDAVFLLAQSLTATLGSTVFVSLRPSTFYDSKLRGSLAAYQPRVFLVSPPRISQVIAKRLGFARLLLGKQGDSETGLSVSGADLLVYLDSLETAFTKNEDLIALLENMSGGNTRVALEYLSAFIGSGYVDAERVLEVTRSGRTYAIPMHEFLRSIIFGDFEFFDPEASRILNLFDISEGDEREHFLLPLLLAEVKRAGTSSVEAGFVDAGSLYAEAQKWGFRDVQVEWQLRRAVARGLLDTPPDRADEGPFRITSIGAYMTERLVSVFSYVDAMVVDTPILDPTARSLIRDVRSIEDRLARATAFKTYLDDSWSGFPLPASLPFDWNSHGPALAADIALAGEKASNARTKWGK